MSDENVTNHRDKSHAQRSTTTIVLVSDLCALPSGSTIAYTRMRKYLLAILEREGFRSAWGRKSGTCQNSEHACVSQLRGSPLFSSVQHARAYDVCTIRDAKCQTLYIIVLSFTSRRLFFFLIQIFPEDYYSTSKKLVYMYVPEGPVIHTLNICPKYIEFHFRNLAKDRKDKNKGR